MQLLATLESVIERLKQELLPSYRLTSLLQDLSIQGAQIFLVGGAVRDLFFKGSITDMDIEVHNLSLRTLEDILRRYGIVRTRGKQFAVLSIDGIPIDWSLPRSDGIGRHPEVIIDPFMGINNACARRDLTMNAMAINLITYQLHDPFGGLKDMAQGILRAPVPEKFKEDPLRFYRVMQFIGRFEMVPDTFLNQLCAALDMSAVSQERIVTEFEKLFLKSKRPSLGILWLSDIKRLEDVMPELYASVALDHDNLKQMCSALDALACSEKIEGERIVFMLAALLYPLKRLPIEQQKVALSRITNRCSLFHTIIQLSLHADDPLVYAENNFDMAVYKKLAYKLSLWNGTCRDLVFLSQRLYDLNDKKQQTISLFQNQAIEYGVFDGPIKPLLTGKDFILSVTDGRSIGTLLKRAYDLQITQNITDKEELFQKIFN